MRRLVKICVWIAILGGAGWLALQWMRANPQHVPFAPLKLSHPIGYATQGKIIALGDSFSECQQILREGGVKFQTLPTKGSGSCIADQQTRLTNQKAFPVGLAPAGVAPSCPVSTALVLWQRDIVQPAAEAHFGKKVTAMRHMGSYNCRNVAGQSYRSEHATGNAIDIAAFTLEGDTTISVLKGWESNDPAVRAFLRQVRDGGCQLFSTVLSPDYNKAHADHFHLDMAARPADYAICR